MDVIVKTFASYEEIREYLERTPDLIPASIYDGPFNAELIQPKRTVNDYEGSVIHSAEVIAAAAEECVISPLTNAPVSSFSFTLPSSHFQSPYC